MKKSIAQHFSVKGVSLFSLTVWSSMDLRQWQKWVRSSLLLILKDKKRVKLRYSVFLHLHKNCWSDFSTLFHSLVHQLWCFHSGQAISIPPALLIILFHIFILVSHGVCWSCLMRVAGLQLCHCRPVQSSPEDTTALKTCNRGQKWKSKSILKRHLLIDTQKQAW